MPMLFGSKNKSKLCKNVLVSIYFFQHFFCKSCFLENFAFWSTAFGPMVFLLVSICFFQQNHKPPKTLTKMCTEILIGFDLFQRFYAGLANFVNSKPMRFTLVSIWIFHNCEYYRQFQNNRNLIFCDKRMLTKFSKLRAPFWRISISNIKLQILAPSSKHQINYQREEFPKRYWLFVFFYFQKALNQKFNFQLL